MAPQPGGSGPTQSGACYTRGSRTPASPFADQPVCLTRSTGAIPDMPSATYSECFAACNAEPSCLAFSQPDGDTCAFHDVPTAAGGDACFVKNTTKYVGVFEASAGQCASDYTLVGAHLQACAEACTGACTGFSALERAGGVDCAFYLSGTVSDVYGATCYRVKFGPVAGRDNLVLRFEEAVFIPTVHDTPEFREYARNMIVDAIDDGSVQIEFVSEGSVVIHMTRALRNAVVLPSRLVSKVMEGGDPYDLGVVVTVAQFGEVPEESESVDSGGSATRNVGLVIGGVVVAGLAILAYKRG